MAMMTPQMNNYLASQQKRLTDAQKSGNKDLVTRLTNDIARFNKYTPLKSSKPTTPYVTNTNNIVSYDSLNDPTNAVKNAVQNMNKTIENSVDRVNQNGSQMNENQKQNGSQPITNQMKTDTNQVNEFNYNPTTDSRYAQYFKPMESFNYDPKSDPMYQTMLQNALNNARSNARVASQNALESLNDRGISNSSIAQNQLAQIEQNALTNAQSQLETSLLPQLVNQAYQRYQDGIANRNNQFNMDRSLTGDAYQRFLDSIANKRADNQLSMQEADLTGVYNGQQTLASKNAERANKLNEANVTGIFNGAKTLEAQRLDQVNKQFEFDKQQALAKDTEENRRWQAEWNRSGQEAAKRLQLDWAQLSQREKERISDQAMKEKNYQLDVQQQKWAESVNNPLNQQREANASSKSEPTENEYVSDQISSFINAIRGDEMDYDTALTQINDLQVAGKLTKEQADKIRSALDQVGLKPQPTDWNAINNKVKPYLTVPSVLQSASSTLIPGLGKALKPFINK